MPLSKMMGITCVGAAALVALAIGAASLSPTSPPQVAASTDTAPPDASASAPSGDSADALQEYTPKDFEQYAYDKTKADIRAKFGPPDMVEEDRDSWVYGPSNSQLAVVDRDAGRRVFVRLTFLGDDGPGDKVASVTAF